MDSALSWKRAQLAGPERPQTPPQPAEPGCTVLAARPAPRPAGALLHAEVLHWPLSPAHPCRPPQMPSDLLCVADCCNRVGQAADDDNMSSEAELLKCARMQQLLSVGHCHCQSALQPHKVPLCKLQCVAHCGTSSHLELCQGERLSSRALRGQQRQHQACMPSCQDAQAGLAQLLFPAHAYTNSGSACNVHGPGTLRCSHHVDAHCCRGADSSLAQTAQLKADSGACNVQCTQGCAAKSMELYRAPAAACVRALGEPRGGRP